MVEKKAAKHKPVIGVKLKKKAVQKGNAIPDSKPINSYKKVAKEGIRARNAGRTGR